MATFQFACDKDKSLQIVKDILSHLKTDNDVIYHENMEVDQGSDSDNEDSQYNVVPHRHKLAIIELGIGLDLFDISQNVSDHYTQLMSKETYTKYLDYDRSTSIEIYGGSQIDSNNEISLVAHLHGTEFGSDISYPTFSYDSTLRCWLIRDSSWGAEEGISGNGIITILDFTDYF
jgi:hypothetical protein